MTATARKRQLAFSGPSEANEEQRQVAERIGRTIAEAGCTLVCGGLSGAMEAACKGARDAGGTTVGILPGYAAHAANRYVDCVIPTGMGQARNALVVAAGEAIIALAGSSGTLSEVALAVRLGRPVVLVGDWPNELLTLLDPVSDSTRVVIVQNPDEAVREALSLLS